jgi:hypothetical protein
MPLAISFIFLNGIDYKKWGRERGKENDRKDTYTEAQWQV